MKGTITVVKNFYLRTDRILFYMSKIHKSNQSKLLTDLNTFLVGFVLYLVEVGSSFKKGQGKVI